MGFGNNIQYGLNNYGDTEEVLPIVITPGIQPNTGILYGGTPFTIIDPPSNAGYSDTFNSFNPSLWMDVSSGFDMLTVDNGLMLKPYLDGGGTAALRSTNEFSNFNVSISYLFPLDTLLQYQPSSDITLVFLRAYVNSSNYFTIEHNWNASAQAMFIDVFVVTNGISIRLVHYPLVTSITTSSGTLRIIGINGRVQAYAGSTLLTDYYGWLAEPLNIDIGASSSDPQLSLITTVTPFIANLLVTFGGQPVPSIISNSTYFLTALTPPYPLPEIVDVSVYTINTQYDLGRVWTYTAPLQLTTTLDRSIGTMIIADDDSMTDTSPTLPGLRL